MYPDVDQMGVSELKALRAGLDLARREGVIGKLAMIARQLGVDVVEQAAAGEAVRTSPRYLFVREGLEIYQDDYGNYLTVSSDGRRVCSTKWDDQFFIPGPWLSQALAFYSQANTQYRNRQVVRSVLGVHQ